MVNKQKDKLIQFNNNTKVIFGMIKTPLFLLLFVIFGGATLIYFTDNADGPYAKAVYAILSISSFREWKNFPPNLLMQIMYFVIPILGLTGGIGLVREIIASSVSMKNRSLDWEIRLASHIKNPIVICGLGRIGTQVVIRLIEKGYKRSIIIIHDNHNQPSVYNFRKQGIPVVLGDMTEQLTLLQANIVNASLIILATEKDDVNFKTIVKINENIKENSSPKVIFNVFDYRIAELIKNYQKGGYFKLKLYPVDISNELAYCFYKIIKDNNVTPSSKYALCGLGRVGFLVVKLLVNEGVNLDNISVIDKNLKENIFLRQEPIKNLQEKNLIEMDIVDFYCIAENTYDVCIITTGDDISNIIYDNYYKYNSLNIVRTKKSIVNHDDISIKENNKQTVWVNTSYTSGNKIIEVFENEIMSK